VANLNQTFAIHMVTAEKVVVTWIHTWK